MLLIYYCVFGVILLFCGFYFFGRPRDKAFDELMDKKIVFCREKGKEAKMSPSPSLPTSHESLKSSE